MPKLNTSTYSQLKSVRNSRTLDLVLGLSYYYLSLSTIVKNLTHSVSPLDKILIWFLRFITFFLYIHI